MAEVAAAAWWSHRPPLQSTVARELAASAGIRAWQTQLGATLHGLARVCATEVTLSPP
jgi:hypothetical protein